MNALSSLNSLNSRTARVAAAVVAQLALVAFAVSGQLSARLTGDEYAFRVEPIDPIDPFRGAYVTLDYPDLVPNDQNLPGDRGDVFLPLTEDGEVWAAGTPTRTRPGHGPYLACTDRNYEIRCGIDSWFLPQDDARELEDAIRDGHVVARVRIDGRGNAALVAVDVR
jgi:uncharacterized membrane-anchored protein